MTSFATRYLNVTNSVYLNKSPCVLVDLIVDLLRRLGLFGADETAEPA
jgi:hypothetical protein